MTKLIPYRAGGLPGGNGCVSYLVLDSGFGKEIVNMLSSRYFHKSINRSWHSFKGRLMSDSYLKVMRTLTDADILDCFLDAMLEANISNRKLADLTIGECLSVAVAFRSGFKARQESTGLTDPRAIKINWE